MRSTYTGQSDHEAWQAIKRHGENTIPEKKKDTLLISFFKQFKSPLIYVLLVVASITVILGEYSDAIVISIVVIVNSIIGTVQNRKASTILDSLKSLSQSRSKVIRGGRLLDLPIHLVAVGDYVVLSAGDIIPADGIVIEYTNLQIDESKITGESMPVLKSESDTQVYRSTVVVSGTGICVIGAVGTETLIGKSSNDILENVYNETVLEKKVRKLIRFILFVVLISVTVTFVIGLFRGVPVLELFNTSIALAVSALPEGLPIVVTVVLAIGAWRISKVKGLLKNLPSGATLATVSYICTDKTGTLTEGNISVKKIINVSSLDDSRVHEYILHSLDIKKVSDTVIGDILDLKLDAYIKGEVIWKETKELPFTSENKFNAKEYIVGTDHVQLFKGAPELFTDNTQLIEEYVREGYRVLGIGYKNVVMGTDFTTDGAILVGLIIFEDSIRSDVAQAIGDCKEAGLRIIMITGDNIHTAQHVAREVGILENPETDRVFLGKDLANYSDEELTSMLSCIKVVARANPLDKLRIVRLLQESNEIVAMTGDGVNDGPSIARADIGIAMGKTGTEVAKQAADFILVEDSFSNIRDGIFEARTIIENIKKTIIFLFSTSLGEILIVGGSVSIGLPLPLLPAQILWLNLITDGFLDISLANEKSEDAYKKYNYTRYRGGILNRYDMFRIVAMSVTMASISLASFAVSLRTYALDITRSGMLIIMTVFQWFNALNVRRHTDSILTYNIFSNKYVTAALILEVFLLLASIYTKIGNRLLDTVPVEYMMLLILFMAALPIIAVDELYKYGQK